jgi:hypothetical protein
MPKKRKAIPKAEYHGELVLGDMIFPCAVLENGTRIIKEANITRNFSAYGGRNYRFRDKFDSSGQLPLFLALKCLYPFIHRVFSKEDLMAIEYIGPNGVEHTGYPATILPKICELWLTARDHNKLKKTQSGQVAKADILMRSLANVGITALVDEATGYQSTRADKELQAIFQAYIAKELQKWKKMFPDEFYKQLFRLNGWYSGKGIHKKPRCIASWTKKLVYDELDKGVAEELKRLTLKNERMHQHLTKNFGVIKLKEQIQKILMLFRLCSNMQEVWEMFEKAKSNELPN